MSGDSPRCRTPSCSESADMLMGWLAYRLTPERTGSRARRSGFGRLSARRRRALEQTYAGLQCRDQLPEQRVLVEPPMDGVHAPGRRRDAQRYRCDPGSGNVPERRYERDAETMADELAYDVEIVRAVGNSRLEACRGAH